MNARVFPIRFMSVLPIVLVAIGVALAHDSKSTPSTTDPQFKVPLKIVPVVSLKPGETKKLLLSTHCTVGATRGGGFGITEMRSSTPIEDQTDGSAGASYSQDGVVIRLPGWDTAEKFASLPLYASLKESGIAVFEVTISASNDAKFQFCTSWALSSERREVGEESKIILSQCRVERHR